MARASLKDRVLKRWRGIALAIGIAAAPTVAFAAMPVIDLDSIRQGFQQLAALKEQITLITQQIEETTKIFGVLNDVSKFVQEQVDAIGALGQIHLPFVNLVKTANQLKADAQCLLVDWEKMIPDLHLDDLDFASICSARSGYAKALLFDPADAEGLDWQEQEEARKAVKKRRERVMLSAAVDGLAHATVATNRGVQDAEAATAELDAAARAAEDVNTRLAVIAQGQVLISRQLATQNQLLASLLKVQSSMAVQSSKDQEPLEGGDEGQEADE